MAGVKAAVKRRARLAVRVLSRHAKVVDPYLFRSHVYGHPDKWSDIDIAVFVAGAEKWDLFREVRISTAV